MKDETLKDIKRIDVKVLRKLNTKDTTIGTCSKKEENIYEIEIKGSLDRKSFVSTLAHEVAHANQFAEGRLQHSSRNFVWSSVLYSTADHTHEEYMAWPWEREARSIEDSYMSILENRTTAKKIK